IELSSGGGLFGGGPSVFRKAFWRCEIATYKCATLDSVDYAFKGQLKNGPSWVNRSPDKKWDVFWNNPNLFVRPPSATDAETMGTRDSVRRTRSDTTKAVKKDDAK